MPCTADDPLLLRRVGVCGIFPAGCYSLLLGREPVTLTTGSARVEIMDANNVPGELIAASPACGGHDCMTEPTGHPFDCSLPTADSGVTGAGAALAAAFATLDNVGFGDTATTLVLGLGAPLPGSCVGDCNSDGAVSIAELVTAVGIVLGDAPATDCPALEPNARGEVTVDELIDAVTASVNGCG